jgi:4-methyl-5(b-hydroxyethyl)-thiazole monophosphate biosynthesis
MVYVFLANGFEEIEALSTVDILRRASIAVTTVGINGKEIKGAHNITVTADVTVNESDFADISAAILPGGMPGTLNLNTCKKLCSLLKACAKNNVLIAAICAAPSVLGNLELLKGKNYTCYPGFEAREFGVFYKLKKCVTDEKFFPLITAKGPGVANDFAFSLVDYLTKDNSISANLKQEMQF